MDFRTTTTTTTTTARRGRPEMGGQKHRQLPSLLLFLGAVLLLNLCPPFQSADWRAQPGEAETSNQQQHDTTANRLPSLYSLEACSRFVRLMFTNPLRLERRPARFFAADAKVIGKMVKVLYIKKKIKKLGKKLKKHTIAVPVFTAIPIYEHPYFPQPPLAHLPPAAAAAAAMHHAAAASAFMPTVAQLTTTMNPLGPALPANGLPLLASSPPPPPLSPPQMTAANGGPLNAAASNTHQQVAPFRMPPAAHHQNAHHQAKEMPPPHLLHPAHLAAAQQIINHYAPSPPIFVDETGGLYGTYGNAYGRYDGGYHIW